MAKWKVLVLESVLLIHECVFLPTQPSTSSVGNLTSEKERIWLSMSINATSPQPTASLHYRHFKSNSTDPPKEKSRALFLYISVSVGVSSVAIVLIFSICFCRSEKRKKEQLRISRDDDGGVIRRQDIELIPTNPLIDPDLPTSETFKRNSKPPVIPRDIWEIPRESLWVGIKLGEGAFGLVFKGIQTVNGSETRVVAVKTVKENADPSDLQDLLREFEIMKKLKHDPNVVRCFGAILHDVEHPLVIVEFVPFGDLLGYLRKSRGIQDTCYTQINHLPITSLTSEDLLKFAINSAKGMQYLSRKKIVHRDLAARNVLVGEGRTCKITDFGMARDVKERQDEIYTRTTRGLIPVKWTAIESIIRGTYTTKSDVWSFGVLLFEILTVGGCPYPTMSGQEVRQFISEGYRMVKPIHVDNELYAVMLECWNSNPRKRPTFKELVYTLKRLESHHREYINLSQYDPCHYENIDKTLDL